MLCFVLFCFVLRLCLFVCLIVLFLFAGVSVCGFVSFVLLWFDLFCFVLFCFDFLLLLLLLLLLCFASFSF